MSRLKPWTRIEFFGLSALMLFLLGGANLFTLYGAALINPDARADMQVSAWMIAYTMLFGSMIFLVWFVGGLGGKSLHDMGFRATTLSWVMAAVLLAGVFIPVRVGALLVLDVLLGTEFTAEQSAEDDPFADDFLFVEPSVLAILWIAVSVCVLIALVGPIAEEMYFRGVLYRWLRQRLGVLPSVFISSAIFGLAHLIPSLMITAFVLGVVLALAYEYSESLWIPIVIHVVNNSIVIGFIILAAIAVGATL